MAHNWFCDCAVCRVAVRRINDAIGHLVSETIAAVKAAGVTPEVAETLWKQLPYALSQPIVGTFHSAWGPE